jgi:uncharacterized damage-inducible protein DinB
MELESLQYPIGRYRAPENIDGPVRTSWLRDIASLPAELSASVQQLTDAQLDTPYRDGGWTVRQVVHHVADSHLNSQIRFRWALTEETPLIKAYDEALWAELPDARSLPVQVSLDLLDGLHRRWTSLLRAMTDADFRRRLRHPVSGECDLNWMLGLYAWHGRHHTAHISSLKTRLGW